MTAATVHLEHQLPLSQTVRPTCSSTQQLLAQYVPAVLQFGLVHISAGDLLRAEVAAGTAAGQEAASYMDSGNLVPNSVVVDMITNRLEQQDVQEHGWLLDGYPRSGEQAEAIEQKGIKPDLFVLISVSTRCPGPLHLKVPHPESSVS